MTTYARRTGRKKKSASVSLTDEEIAIAKARAVNLDKSWSAYVADLIRKDNRRAEDKKKGS